MIRERRHQWCSAEALGKAMRTEPSPATANGEAPEATCCPDCGEPIIVVPTASLVGIRPGKLPEPTVTLNAEGDYVYFLHDCAHPKPQGTGGALLRSHGRPRECQGLLLDGAAA